MASAQNEEPAQEAVPEEAPKIHVLEPQTVAGKERWTPRRRRRFWTLLTFFPCVVLPVLLAAIYYFSYAADRYVVETKFAIRSPGAAAPTDLLGLVTGVSASGSSATDSYMVSDFIESRDLLDGLERRVDLRAIYDHPQADFLTRFDSTKSKEDFVKYLQRMISVYFDTSSQIITVEVQAFTPEDAELVANEVLGLSGDLVNQISERARQDTLRSAEAEVARMETKLRDHRAALAVFREQEQDIDPTRSVETQQALLGEIEGQLTVARTELSTVLQFLREDAPRVKILESQIAALEAQLEEQRARLGVGDVAVGSESGGGEGNATLSARIGAYEELAVDLEFLQQAYVASLASLEAARLEADRQQRYLASFVLPSTPEKALYPNRVQNVLVVVLFSLLFWGISVMAVYVVREHAT